MGYIIAIVVSVLVLAAFVSVTLVERRRGSRLVLKGVRGSLDRRVGGLFYVAQHVDFPAFLEHQVRSGVEHFAHEIAHGSLLFVRFVERQLTRTVQYLRRRRARGSRGRMDADQ